MLRPQSQCSIKCSCIHGEEDNTVNNNVKINLKSEFVLQQVKESISTITDNQRSMQSGFDQVSKQIKDRAQQLMKEVKKWEQHNLQKLQDIKQQQDKSLQEALEKFETLQSTLHECKQYVEILRERGKDSEKTSRCPGLQALVQKQRKTQPERTRWHSKMILQHEGPWQQEALSEIRGSISSYLAIFEGPKHKQTISIQCKGAVDIRLVTLFGHQQVLHSFWSGKHPENENKICIHNTDGCVRRLLTIPKMNSGESPVVVDPSGGKLVMADHNEGRHASGYLHWIALSQTYDIIKHEITQLECRPWGYINVGSSGQVLVITWCTSREHPKRLVIYDKDTHGELQVINLPGMLRCPMSAVNSTPGVFTVVYNGTNKVVWLDGKGQVLRMYGDRPDEVMNGPHHIVKHTEGYLLISDYYNHRLHLLDRNGAFLQYCVNLDYIECPRAISLDEQAGLLAVSSHPGTVRVFSLRLQTDYTQQT